MWTWLSDVGSEPHLVGLATVGGLVSFALAIVAGAKWIYSRRSRLTTPIAESRRQNARIVKADFRLARRMRKIGFSSLTLVRMEVEQISREIVWLVLCALVMSLNVWLGDRSLSSQIVVFIYVIMIMASALKVRRLVRRAVAKVSYADAPTVFFDLAREEIKRAGRGRKLKVSS